VSVPETFLDELAARSRIPAGGAAAAAAVAMAAALAAKGARFSVGSWPEAEGAVAQAQALRLRVAGLATKNEGSYAQALGALGEPREEDPARRDWQLGRALAAATEVLLELAEAGAAVAELAATVAELGEQELRPDMAVAAALAEAGTRAAAHLVAVNLGIVEDDPRVPRAKQLAQSAAEAARTAAAL